MPFKDHEVFVAPENEDQKIWRYMDFTKFLYLLEYRNLYFPSLKTLADKDPFEGSYGKENVDFRQLSYQDYQTLGGDAFKSEKDFELFQETMEKVAPHRKAFREVMYVNCWHMNDHESAAMWSVYLSANEGIAITSSYSKLKMCFSDNKETVYIGKVNYIDYHNSFVPEKNSFSPAVHKSLGFSYERELRAFHCNIGEGLNLLEKGAAPAGISFNVHLETLIDEIYVSPACSTWFKNLVTKVAGRYGFGDKIKDSTISGNGYF